MNAPGSLNAVVLALVALVLATPSPSRADEKGRASSRLGTMRIEQEEKLVVPNELADDVLAFLRERFVEDRAHLAELDPLFTTYVHVEDFTDVYYDTPSLQLLAMQSGVRHRTRFNRTDPGHKKSGRQLMQVKLNDISDNELERGEIKFDVERVAVPQSAEEKHPMLGIIRKKDREPFQNRLVALGLDPWSMRPVLEIRQLRTRVYFDRGKEPFMSISFDRVSSQILWAAHSFVELEPELNEKIFTDADPQTRSYMESILEKIVGEIEAAFPRIRSDLTPKYNKSFVGLETGIPYLRALVLAGPTSLEQLCTTPGRGRAPDPGSGKAAAE